MKRIVENFREFLDLAKINQGPDGWTIYGSNPKYLSSTERVSFPELKIKSISAKVDTGADSTSIEANDIRVKNGILYFWVTSPKEVLEVKDFKKIKVNNPNGSKERYQILTKVKFNNAEFKIKVSLADRKNMKYPCILGRNFIKMGNFKIDINQ